MTDEKRIAERAYNNYYYKTPVDMPVNHWTTAYIQGMRCADKNPYQAQVHSWMHQCFGPEILMDRYERNHRFIEEALELVQACGMPVHEAHLLVDYVYGRPVGEIEQEVGGVMVTLHALCNAHSIDVTKAGDVELARCWGNIEKIRAKQASKPKSSPLPMAKQPDRVTYQTFEEFVEYGRASTANPRGGMPWNFQWQGQPVSHENDSCYIVGNTHFNKGDLLFYNHDLKTHWVQKPSGGSMGGDLESDYKVETPHPDDVAVDQMAKDMKERLRQKREEEGFSGWKDECSADELSLRLMESALKGKALDVANFAMFLHLRKDKIQKESLAVVTGHHYNVSLIPMTMFEALRSANEVCRSALAIAIAEGGERIIRHNWPGFIKQTQESLKLQHAVMHPDGAQSKAFLSPVDRTTVSDIKALLKYPEEWDTIAYPTLYHAAHEVREASDVEGFRKLEALIGESLSKFNELQAALKAAL